MKLTKLKCIAAIALFAALVIPAGLAAQNNKNPQHHHYKLIDMGTFGGPESYINNAMSLGAPNQINRLGTTVGSSATSIPSPPHTNLAICGGLDGTVPFVFHAFQWQDGKVTDLGALPGHHNCSVASSINARGEIAGSSEISVIDPVLNVREIRAVLWKNGKNGRITNLKTFGGNFSIVSAINDRGQVAGSATNAIADPFSILYLLQGSSKGTQTRAFLWQNGHKKDLGTLGGPDAATYGLNNNGQVIGSSYINSIPNSTTGLPTADPFLWDPKTKNKKKMKDLGTLGGVYGWAWWFNNKGQVIGYSSLAADPGACLKALPDPNCHPFLWDAGKNNGNLLDLTVQSGGVFVKANAINIGGAIAGLGNFSGTLNAALWKDGVVTDLGHLAGDCSSEAFAINSKDQVVGSSVACNGDYRSFLWENGSMVDLHTLIPPNSSLDLLETLAINDRGEIAGDGVPSGCQGDGTCGHAYVLIPCDDNHDDGGDCEDNAEGATVTAQSSAAPVTQNPTTTTEGLGALRGRFGRRYPHRGSGTFQPK